MKFSGHETFPLRQGWLHKGMRLLVDHPDRWKDEFVADWLGVGGNMAKSIRHWMICTGLVEARNSKSSPMRATDFGKLVYERDPFFADEGTWWMLHINLASNQDKVTTWHWFFNQFAQPRFDKAVALNQLRQSLQYTMPNPPSPNTLDRDVLCLLASYSKVVPNDRDDPEDSRESPFAELGLMTHFRLSGTYELNMGPKSIPPHVLGYALRHYCRDSSTESVGVMDAATRDGSPGRLLCLSGEGLYEEIVRAEKGTEGEISLEGMAGERRVRFGDWTAQAWADLHYRSTRRAGRKPTKVMYA